MLTSFKLFFESYSSNEMRISPETILEIKSIPESKLGYSTSLDSLPTTKPYGFWISRHGNFIVVNQRMGHADAAYKIGNILWNSYKINPGFYDSDFSEAMSFMNAIGNCRVIMDGPNGMYIDLFEPTNGQRKTLSYIKDLYNLSN